MKRSLWIRAVLPFFLAGVLVLSVPSLAQERDPSDFADTGVIINPALTFALVYAEPNTDADINEALSGGVTVTLTGEAQSLDDGVWWEIEPPSGQIGWLPERQDDLPTMLLENGIPLSLSGETSVAQPTRTPTRTAEPSGFSEAGEKVIVAVDLLLLYAEANSSGDIVEALTRNLSLAILAPSEVVGGETWWNVRSPSGAEGWILDTVDDVPTFVSAALTGDVLARGGEAGVSPSAGVLLVYAEPDSDSPIIEGVGGGVILRILDGPEVINRVRWWQVRLPSGGEGWTPETVEGVTILIAPNAMVTPTLVPTLTPTPAPTRVIVPMEVAVGVEVQIVSIEPDFPVRASPSMRAGIQFALARSERATVIGGPQAVSEAEGGVPQDFTWWQIRTANGSEGWIQESYYGEPILIPYNAANPVGVVTCTLSTFRDVNVRSGPGTSYQQVASREGANQLLAADGQFGDITVPESHWWRLYDGFWIRNDQVSEQTRDSCAALPVVSAN